MVKSDSLLIVAGLLGAGYLVSRGVSKGISDVVPDVTFPTVDDFIPDIPNPFDTTYRDNLFDTIQKLSNIREVMLKARQFTQADILLDQINKLRGQLYG